MTAPERRMRPAGPWYACKLQEDMYRAASNQGLEAAERRKLGDMERLLPPLREAAQAAGSALQAFVSKGTASAVPEDDAGRERL